MQDNQKNSIKNYLIVVLLISLIISIVFHFRDKKEIITNYTTQVETVKSEKESIQAEFIASAAKVDSLSAYSTKLEGELANKQVSIVSLKNQISTILKKKNNTDAELDNAKTLIAELNTKINGLITEIAQVKEQNVQLNNQNQQLTQEKAQIAVEKQAVEQNLSNTKKELDEKIDIASTLHASFFKLTSVRTKKNGKEKETSSAKKIDKFLIEFTIDDNRISQSGAKEIFVVVTDPSGNIISDGATFKTREEGDKKFSDKLTIQFEKGKSTPVSYKKPVKGLSPGNYLIQVYNNGFKIGEGLKELK